MPERQKRAESLVVVDQQGHCVICWLALPAARHYVQLRCRLGDVDPRLHTDSPTVRFQAIVIDRQEVRTHEPHIQWVLPPQSTTRG